MRRTKRFCSWRLMLVSAAMIASTAGCATIQSTLTPAWTPSQTAGLRRPHGSKTAPSSAISSPTRYACNGKVYTSFQLAKLRMDEEKNYASSK